MAVYALSPKMRQRRVKGRRQLQMESIYYATVAKPSM